MQIRVNQHESEKTIQNKLLLKTELLNTMENNCLSFMYYTLLFVKQNSIMNYLIVLKGFLNLLSQQIELI